MEETLSIEEICMNSREQDFPSYWPTGQLDLMVSRVVPVLHWDLRVEMNAMSHSPVVLVKLNGIREVSVPKRRRLHSQSLR